MPIFNDDDKGLIVINLSWKGNSSKAATRFL